MKVAVSIPEPIFQAAEREAKLRKWSRSRLYTEALRAYLKKQVADRVSEKLNASYGAEDSRIPEHEEMAQLESLEPEEW